MVILLPVVRIERQTSYRKELRVHRVQCFACTCSTETKQLVNFVNAIQCVDAPRNLLHVPEQSRFLFSVLRKYLGRSQGST